MTASEHRDSVRTQWQGQNTVTVSEHNDSIRTQRQRQNTVTGSEHRDSVRTQWQCQNTMTASEHRDSVRTQWQCQNSKQLAPSLQGWRQRHYCPACHGTDPQTAPRQHLRLRHWHLKTAGGLLETLTTSLFPTTPSHGCATSCKEQTVPSTG